MADYLISEAFKRSVTTRENELQAALLVLHKAMVKDWPNDINLSVNKNGILATAKGFGVSGSNVSDGNPLAEALIRFAKKVVQR